jgi:hypothetical protein
MAHPARWLRLDAAFLALALLAPASARAESKPANPDVAAVLRDPRIAAALAAAERMDAALIADDRAAFTAGLASDLAVNNPQNGVSVQAATGRRNAAGLISYTSYDRTIEYVGLRGGMVVLMGEERVVPRAGDEAGKLVRRRFTDLWRLDKAAGC